MFLRTSSLKRLNSFRVAENIPCCVQKNTSLKFHFVVCKQRDYHNIGKQYGGLSSLWAIRLYSLHVCLPYSRQVSKPTGLWQIQNCCFFEEGFFLIKKKRIAKLSMLYYPSEFSVSHRSVISSMGTLCVRT